MLARWTAATETPAAASPAQGSIASAAVDLERMASVRDEMGDEGLSELVDMLLRDVAESSAAFRELADAGQLAEIGRQAHRLKGSCRVLGFID